MCSCSRVSSLAESFSQSGEARRAAVLLSTDLELDDMLRAQLLGSAPNQVLHHEEGEFIDCAAQAFGLGQRVDSGDCAERDQNLDFAPSSPWNSSAMLESKLRGRISDATKS